MNDNICLDRKGLKGRGLMFLMNVIPGNNIIIMNLSYPATLKDL